MKALVLTLNALEPLLLAKPESGEENSANSYDYIPGSAIRGAIIHAWLRRQSRQELNLRGDSQDRKLFFDGGCRFLNGYPMHAETKRRCLPAPFTWQVPKDEVNADPAAFINLALHAPEADETYKSHSCNFFSTLGDGIRLQKTRMTQTPHNASADANRKDAESSTVFRYISIGSGQGFQSAILCDQEKQLDLIKDCLVEEVMFLGGSHRAGYGRIGVSVEFKEKWEEYQPEGCLGEADTISVTLLSDALIRDRDGRSGLGFDAALSQWLGLSQPLKHLDSSSWRLALAGGYNRKWGLPLPQDYVFQAGSTFVYQAADFGRWPEEQRLQQGIGERRAEGFGRLGLNLSVKESFEGRIAQSIQTAAETPAMELSVTSRELARQLADSRFKNLLDRRLAEFISKKVDEVSRPPRKAQLSRMRSAANRAYARNDLHPLAEHIDNLKRDSAAQFEECYIDGQPMKDWLSNLVTAPDAVKLLFGNQPIELPAVGGETARIQDYQARYTALAVSGLMRALAKKEDK